MGRRQHYLDGVELVDPRPVVVWVSSERDLQQRQEAVHPGQQTLRTGQSGVSPRCLGSAYRDSGGVLRVRRGVLGGNAVEHNDPVGQVGRHDEVVFHHERRLLRVEDVPVQSRWGQKRHRHAEKKRRQEQEGRD